MPEFPQIAAAARAYLDEHGEAELSAAYRDLAGQFGVKDNPYGTTEKQRWDTFRGQVQRAFAALTRDGACTKVGAHLAGPDGTYAPSPRYFTPAAWEAAHKRGEAADAAARDEADRWETVHGRLAALGILTADPGHLPGRRQPPRLQDAHQWERLLDWAADGYGHAWGVRPP